MSGLRTCLVEKARFPRWKVCGCCLNGAALATLEQLNLGRLPERLNGSRLSKLQLGAGGHPTELPIPDGISVSRERFDEALVREATASGAVFLSEVTASWGRRTDSGVVVHLASKHDSKEISARVVVAGDGLVAGFTRQVPGVRTIHRTGSRIGAGTVLPADASELASGVIRMAVARGGYVGMVRLEEDRLNVAAAFDSGLVRRSGGLAQAAAQVIRQSGLPVPDKLDYNTWRGTPPLTRQYIAPENGRLFLIGDAAEYVEPFTGEGMAWALAAGQAVVPYLRETISGNATEAQHAWALRCRELLGSRKAGCRWLTLGLRRPFLTRIGIRLLDAWPGLACPYLGRLNTSAGIG